MPLEVAALSVLLLSPKDQELCRGEEVTVCLIGTPGFGATDQRFLAPTLPPSCVARGSDTQSRWSGNQHINISGVVSST